MVLKKSKYGFQTGNTLRRKFGSYKVHRSHISLVNNSSERTKEMLQGILDFLYKGMDIIQRHNMYAAHEMIGYVEQLLDYHSIMEDSSVSYSLRKLYVGAYYKWDMLDSIEHLVKNIWNLQQSAEFMELRQELCFNGMVPAMVTQQWIGSRHKHEVDCRTLMYYRRALKQQKRLKTHAVELARYTDFSCYLTVYIATKETPVSIEQYLLDDHGLTAYADYASRCSHESAVKSGKAKVNEVKVEMEYCSTDNVPHASFWQAPTCVRHWTLDCKQDFTHFTATMDNLDRKDFAVVKEASNPDKGSRLRSGGKCKKKSKGQYKRTRYEGALYCESLRRDWLINGDYECDMDWYSDDDLTVSHVQAPPPVSHAQAPSPIPVTSLDRARPMSGRQGTTVTGDMCESWQLVEALLDQPTHSSVTLARHCVTCSTQHDLKVKVKAPIKEDTSVSLTNKPPKTAAQRERRRRKKLNQKLRFNTARDGDSHNNGTILSDKAVPHKSTPDDDVTVKVKPFSIKPTYLQDKFGGAYKESQLVSPRVFAIDLRCHGDNPVPVIIVISVPDTRKTSTLSPRKPAVSASTAVTVTVKADMDYVSCQNFYTDVHNALRSYFIYTVSTVVKMISALVVDVAKPSVAGVRGDQWLWLQTLCDWQYDFHTVPEACQLLATAKSASVLRPTSSKVKVTGRCGRCSANQCLTLACSHCVCVTCLRQSLLAQLSAKQVPFACDMCDAVSGDRCLVDNVVAMCVLSVSDLSVYESLLLHHRLASHPQWRSCPATHCHRVVRLRATSVLDVCVVVHCLCGAAWCFTCTQPAHWPLSCTQADQYRQSLTRLQLGNHGNQVCCRHTCSSHQMMSRTALTQSLDSYQGLVHVHPSVEPCSCRFVLCQRGVSQLGVDTGLTVKQVYSCVSVCSQLLPAAWLFCAYQHHSSLKLWQPRQAAVRTAHIINIMQTMRQLSQSVRVRRTVMLDSARVPPVTSLLANSVKVPPVTSLLANSVKAPPVTSLLANSVKVPPVTSRGPPGTPSGSLPRRVVNHSALLGVYGTGLEPLLQPSQPPLSHQLTPHPPSSHYLTPHPPSSLDRFFLDSTQRFLHQVHQLLELVCVWLSRCHGNTGSSVAGIVIQLEALTHSMQQTLLCDGPMTRASLERLKEDFTAGQQLLHIVAMTTNRLVRSSRRTS